MDVFLFSSSKMITKWDMTVTSFPAEFRLLQCGILIRCATNHRSSLVYGISNQFPIDNVSCRYGKYWNIEALIPQRIAQRELQSGETSLTPDRKTE